jgi:hypothetical protein
VKRLNYQFISDRVHKVETGHTTSLLCTPAQGDANYIILIAQIVIPVPLIEREESIKKTMT